MRAFARSRGGRPLVLALAALATRSVSAEEHRVSGRAVVVECDLLVEGERAALAARLEGEMLLTELEGALHLSCTATELVGTLELSDEKYSAERVSAPGVSLSEAFYELGLETIERAADARDAAAPSVASFPIAGDSAPPSPAAAPISEAPAAEPSALAVPIAPAAPEQAEPAAPLKAAPAKERAPSQRKRLVHELSVSARAAYQHWGREMAGAIGPEIAFGAKFEEFAVELNWAPFFGTNQVQGYAVQDMRWTMLGVAKPFDWLSLGLGPVLSWVQVSAPSNVEEKDQDSLQPGVLAFAEGSLFFQQWSFSLRAGVSALAAARIVQEDDVVRVTIPEVQPLIGIGAGYHWKLGR